MDRTYEFRITLFTTYYDENEVEQEMVYGTRKHVGTEDSAEAFARRTRTKAGAARIERVAVQGGLRFGSHEIKTFSISLDPR